MSTNNDSTQHVQIAVADPTPLGLFGLAVVTMVASAQKLGIVEGVSWVLPWALFCGSFAQLLAGYFDYCHRNIFGATIFSAFGFFWSAVGMSWMIKQEPLVLVWLLVWILKLLVLHFWPILYLPALVPLLRPLQVCSYS